MPKSVNIVSHISNTKPADFEIIMHILKYVRQDEAALVLAMREFNVLF